MAAWAQASLGTVGPVGAGAHLVQVAHGEQLHAEIQSTAVVGDQALLDHSGHLGPAYAQVPGCLSEGQVLR